VYPKYIVTSTISPDRQVYHLSSQHFTYQTSVIQRILSETSKNENTSVISTWYCIVYPHALLYEVKSMYIQ